MRLTAKIFAASALLCVAAGTVSAQQLTTSGTFLDIFSPEVPLGLTIGQGVSYTLPSNLKSGATGEMDLLELETTLSYKKGWKDQRLNVTFDYGYSNYNWSNGAPDYFSDVSQLTLSAIYQYQFDASDWGAYVMASGSLGAESGNASLTAGDSYTASFGASYEFFKNFSFSFGVLVISDLEQGVRYWPVAFLEWTINENLRLRSFNGVTLVYDVNADQETVLDFTVQYNSSSFQLNNQYIPTTGTYTNPAVEAQSVTAGVGITHRFGGPFYVRGYVQGDFMREYTFRAYRNKYQTIKAEPGATFGFEIGANF
ncbi:hypothetical protein H5P28_10695 [Ruficoccus amylovorans]|uniref:Uncharacterized protein n=1 Tax=Ruficoccus amylovorans TaxID=1804625 RepID=A0A842HFA8_9BACT|nr:hypothetical protein [Ruficoccus amylovorans]MBC2594728.1 hypothetical protein [Ruficoccus amylovorans]